MDQEVEKIIDHIEKGENFLLSGGAGSGKTYSLVQSYVRSSQDIRQAKSPV